AAMIYPGEGKEGEPKAGDYVLAAERVRVEAAASPHRSTEFDLARADRWEGQARTKQLPSTRTEIGAGGELIDIENRWNALGVVNTVADPDYVTASASRERLELANEAGSLDLAYNFSVTARMLLIGESRFGVSCDFKVLAVAEMSHLTTSACRKRASSRGDEPTASWSR